MQQVNLLLRRTGGLGPPFYERVDEIEGYLCGWGCVAKRRRGEAR